MSNTLPWNGRDLYLFLSEGKTVLDIRTAREGDPANGVFKASELADLFATAQESGFGIKSQNFVLYGEEKRDDGRPLAIVAEIKKPYQRDGKTLQGSFAYTSKQLQAFTPLSFVVKTKFIPRKGGGHIPTPLFLAYATPFEKTVGEAASSFERVTAKTAETPQSETVGRKKARS